MKNEPVVRSQVIFLGNKPNQAILDFSWSLAFGNSSTVADTKNVSVHSNCRHSERSIQNDVSRLSPNPGKLLQFLSGAWNVSIVVGDQNVACLENVLSLGVEEPDGSDVVLESFTSKRMNCLGSGGIAEQALGIAALTLTSVACAESMTAMSNWNGD